MPKTDVKKIESEDVKELSDEALDRATGGAQPLPTNQTTQTGSSSGSVEPIDLGDVEDASLSAALDRVLKNK